MSIVGRASRWARLASCDHIAAAVFIGALGQFLFFTWWTLDQPIVDMWGFRPAQTAASIPYMLRGVGRLANIVPIFGEPWTMSLEFPLYQWCVAALVWVTGAPIDPCGRLVSAAFAIAVLWPLFLIAKAVGLARARRFTLLAGALWLLAPVVVFWGRSFLIETTTVFLGLAWLAFYIRFLVANRRRDYLACLAFGVLAAVVKFPAFAGFVVIGFIYTCVHVWKGRDRFVRMLPALAFAGSAVVIPAIALVSWGHYTDSLLAKNPLAALLQVSNMPQWYFGTWDDHWTVRLWDWAILRREIPETLGALWYLPLVGLVILGVRSRSFWMTAAMLIGFLSVYMFFPLLHIYNPYYLVENAVFLCAAVALIVEALLQRRQYIVGYAILAVIAASQLVRLHAGVDGMALRDDLHHHPYYLAGLAIKKVTPPDSVIVGFGMGYGADVPYFAGRRGIIVPNGFPLAPIREILFDQRARWFGGRKLGAVVDCTVFENQRIAPNLVPIRDALERELPGKAIYITGSFYGADVTAPGCKIYLP